MDDADRECLAIAARMLGGHMNVANLPPALRAALVKADERVEQCEPAWMGRHHLVSRQVVAAIIAAWEFSQEDTE